VIVVGWAPSIPPMPQVRGHEWGTRDGGWATRRGSYSKASGMALAEWTMGGSGRGVRSSCKPTSQNRDMGHPICGQTRCGPPAASLDIPHNISRPFKLLIMIESSGHLTFILCCVEAHLFARFVVHWCCVRRTCKGSVLGHT
jgi:hypothetical protein